MLYLEHNQQISECNLDLMQFKLNKNKSNVIIITKYCLSRAFPSGARVNPGQYINYPIQHKK